jgi:hypothetical protein
VGHDDLFMAIVRYAPFLFVIGGLLVVAWMAKHPSLAELQPHVLAALSETEALSPAQIGERLTSQRVDADLLRRALDELCGAGLAVRWYTQTEHDGQQPVYRRVSQRVAAAD